MSSVLDKSLRTLFQEWKHCLTETYEDAKHIDNPRQASSYLELVTPKKRLFYIGLTISVISLIILILQI